ncbi:MAG: pentapeptide repeat-containing protein [Kofleriaceae bacterium]|nr:pentapeptide repeat-containing protein [Kofleriaceae bacterium]
MTIPNIGFARSTLEVRFWLYLHPCPECGERDIGEPKTTWGQIGSGGTFRSGGFYDVTCPRCATKRSIAFYTLEDFWKRSPPGHLGFDDPSQIIGPHEFAAELARCLPGLVSEFDGMTKEELSIQGGYYDDGRRAAIELLKFIPKGEPEVPASAFKDADAVAYRAAHPEQFQRAFLEATLERLEPLRDKIEARWTELSQEAAPAEKRRLPLPPFSLAALKLHEQWVDQGDVGENQPIVAKGADAREARLAGRTLAEIVFEKVTLDRADLSATLLDGASWTDVSALDAGLRDAQLRHAQLVRVQLTGSDLRSSKLTGATLVDCDLSEARLAGSFWFRATLERCRLLGADLTDALLAEATFVDCDLRGANLAFIGPGDNTLAEARFVRCDLRDTRWAGRDLRGVRFVDCKLANVRGPAMTEGLIVERADLSAAGEGAQIGTAAEVVQQFHAEPRA